MKDQTDATGFGDGATPKVPRLQISEVSFEDIQKRVWAASINRIVNRGWEFPVKKTRGVRCKKRSLVTW